MISANSSSGACWSAVFYNMTYILARSICWNMLVDVGGSVLSLGTLFFLMTIVKRADSMDVHGG